MKHDTFGEASDYLEPVRNLDPVIHELRKRRYEENISQNELARRMGYSAKALKAVEAGRSSPSFSFLVVWAKALGMKLTVERHEQ